MSKLALDLYKKMYLIREAEKEIRAEYKNDEMKTPMHMSMGEEAIVVGVCAALRNKARIWSTYRSHAIYLARTGDLNGFFAELYGKATGPSGGKAGSMHLANPGKGVMMASAVVGTNISPALGAAFASQTLKDGKINVTFFGDGAVDEGTFWESVNLASLWKLPILFIYEDNGLAIHTSTAVRHGYANLMNIVKQYNYHCLEYNGTDVQKIFNMTRSAVKQMKKGPVFMAFKYYRYLEHVGPNEDFHAGYRDKKDFIKWQKKDSLAVQRKRLMNTGLETKIIKIENKITDQIKNAVKPAKNAPYPPPKSLYEDIYNEK